MKTIQQLLEDYHVATKGKAKGSEPFEIGFHAGVLSAVLEMRKKTITAMDLAELIVKRERQSKKLSQEKLAELAELADAGYVSEIENGKHDVAIKTCARIAKALGVPTWLLMVGVSAGNACGAATKS